MPIFFVNNGQKDINVSPTASRGSSNSASAINRRGQKPYNVLPKYRTTCATQERYKSKLRPVILY